MYFDKTLQSLYGASVTFRTMFQWFDDNRQSDDKYVYGPVNSYLGVALSIIMQALAHACHVDDYCSS